MLGLPVTVIASDVDETVEPGLDPARIVETLSLRKAEAVHDKMKCGDSGSYPARGIIVGSDTIVVLNGEVLGKPVDTADSRRMLQALQGCTHRVYTGVACIDAETGKRRVSHSATEVTMKPLDEERIGRYIASGEPADKAGSYGIQGLGSVLIEKIDGDFYCVMGLPLNLLSDILLEFGVNVL